MIDNLSVTKPNNGSVPIEGVVIIVSFFACFPVYFMQFDAAFFELYISMFMFYSWQLCSEVNRTTAFISYSNY